MYRLPNLVGDYSLIIVAWSFQTVAITGREQLLLHLTFMVYDIL